MSGGYANGFGYGNGNNQNPRAGGGYGGMSNGYSSPPNDGSRPRRPGGYGALSPDNTAERPYGAVGLRPPGMDRADARRRSYNRSRSGQSEGPAEKQIEDVLDYLNKEWSFMLQENCVPVQVALQLLDSSSLGLGRKTGEFQDAKTRLQNALRAVVNEHHQGFNSSIGTFHQIQSSIQASHERIRILKDSLAEAKSNLGTAKPELKALATASYGYANMLDVIEMIEDLQSIPEKLESSISEKRFLAAVDMLQDALKLAKRSELEDIGALADTKVYLSNQELSLADILTEELHNHLYLKSPYCEDRWREFAKNNEQKDGPLSLPGSSRREMFSFLESLDMQEALEEDASKNPEADTFNYIYVIAESLYKLGRLDEAVENIEQRLPVELYKVVDRSNTEMQQKYPSALQAEWKYRRGPLDVPAANSGHNVVLSDLIQTMYARFEAIAEAHRVFYEVVAGITKRETGIIDTRLTRSFKELWKLYQSEMRSLLHDYLSTRGVAERLGNSQNGEANIFRYQRDKNKKCAFKMDLIDGSSGVVRAEREDLVQTWQKFVPGLTSLAKDAAASNDTSSAGKLVDNSAAGHKLLVEPTVFNIGALLPPSVSFLSRLKEIVPPSADIVVSTLSSFLNDFLINVFQPQLEETLTELCSQTFLQLDAFQQDQQWQHLSRKPIFKGTIKFYDIILAFCRMLDDLTHDQLFTNLVITQMNEYYEKCHAWYHTLVSRAQATSDGRQLKAAAMFAESTNVQEIATSLRDADDMDAKELITEECSRLIANTMDHPLEQADLMTDRKNHASLCLMHNSMTWLAAKLAHLRRISERATDSSYRQRDSAPQGLKRRLTTALQASPDDEPAYLPLNDETVTLFDGVIQGITDLADLSLRTLHLELRCHILHTLGPHFRQGSYLLRDPIEAADESVVDLVADMMTFDREARTYLNVRAYAYTTMGYAQLVDTIVMGNIQRHIRAMNPRGREYLQINADVLYHNLLNIAADADLPRTFEFLRLFDQGPNAIVAYAWKGQLKLGYEELRTLIELCFSDAREGGDDERVARAERDMRENLQHLAEALGRT